MNFEHEWMKDKDYDDTPSYGIGGNDAGRRQELLERRRRQEFSERQGLNRRLDPRKISRAAALEALEAEEEKKRESACTGFFCKWKFWGGKRRTKKRRKKRGKKRKTKSRRKTKRRRKSRRTKRRRRKR
tara:strand:+ start:420 stop:806 length:387 start_codon:yes stop_codon:yes gene_type:complete